MGRCYTWPQAPGCSEPFTITFPPFVFTSSPQLQHKAGNVGNATREATGHVLRTWCSQYWGATSISFTYVALHSPANTSEWNRKVERKGEAKK